MARSLKACAGSPGHEGDCTSLFTSPDLVHWEYQGPFYRSRREWTLEPARTAGTVQAAPFHLVAGEPLELRVFIDRSVIEVFANRRQSVYPTRPDRAACSPPVLQPTHASSKPGTWNR